MSMTCTVWECAQPVESYTYTPYTLNHLNVDLGYGLVP